MTNVSGTGGMDTIFVGPVLPNLYTGPEYNLIGTATDGNDTIDAGGGNDVILSGDGSDIVHGGEGNDIIAGVGYRNSVGAFGASVFDPDGNNGDGFVVRGGDQLFGDAGNDQIYAGYDTIVDGGTGIDTVHLSLEDDWLPLVAHSILHWFNDLGVDVDLSQAANGSVTLPVGGLGDLSVTLKNVEAFDITFGQGNDRVFGGAYDDILRANVGNDEMHGGGGNDFIDGQNGADTLFGDAGNDKLISGFNDGASDSLYGGAGNDYLEGGPGDLIDGGADSDWAGILLGGSSFSYNINLDTITSGAAYSFGDANASEPFMTAGTRVAGLEHLSYLELGSGNDIVTTNAAKIEYDPARNTAFSGIQLGAGNDQITINGTLNQTTYKPVDGGSGSDTLILNGNYKTPFYLGNNVFANFETLRLSAGHSYSLIANFNTSMSVIDASALGAANGLTLDVQAIVPNETILGGAGKDTVTIHKVELAPALIDLGGGAADTLILSGWNSMNLDLNQHQIKNVETIRIADTAPFNYNFGLTIADSSVAAGKTLTIDGTALTSGSAQQYIDVDGRGELDGKLIEKGSAGDDTLRGGAKVDQLLGNGGNDMLFGYGGNDTINGGIGNDTLVGGAGADILTGGAGSDTFVFDTLTTSALRDTIKDFVSGTDKIAISRGAFSAFAGDPLGSIAATDFAIGTRATTADQHLIYNITTGALYYDPDGSGAIAQVQIALLTAHPAVVLGDFILAG